MSSKKKTTSKKTATKKTGEPKRKASGDLPPVRVDASKGFAFADEYTPTGRRGDT
jgi:hypothetical protein